MKISIIHAIVGLLAFVLFLISGWYMNATEIGNLPDAQRMIYRTGHIYVLFSALLNLTIGMQLRLSDVRWKRMAQYLGSFLLLATPGLLLYGFYRETAAGDIYRGITILGVFLSLAGIGLHLLIFAIGLLNRKEV